MNQKQKEYAIERVTNIFSSKQQSIEAKYTVESKPISGNEMIDLVLKGKCPKRKNPDRPRYNNSVYLRDVFDFSKFEVVGGTDYKKAGKEIAPIRAEFQRIKDQIMLGDAEEAVKLIEKFAKM
jgi:hypothetical protein